MGYLSYELNDDEKLIAHIKKHWATLTFPIFKVILSIAIIILLYEKLKEFQYGDKIAIIWIIASILYGVYEIIIWNLDCFIITDKRIIDINQKSLFSRTVAEIGIENIQESIYEIKGPLEAIFNFGTVKIKTASSGSMIGMEKIPNPSKVKDLIAKIQKNINVNT